jgi:uncharacterized protein YndB with AHSA1/START domain
MGAGVIISIVVGAMIAGLLGFIGSRAGTFSVSRRRRVSGSPQTVYELLANFHRWIEWSPWEKLDPELKRTFSGPDSGVGAVYEWAGNSKAGEGRMTILEAVPAERVVIKLEFLKPWKMTNRTTFTLTPAEGGTDVDWRMEGDLNFMGKAMGVFMNMDKLVGRDFEQGLENLDRATGGQP